MPILAALGIVFPIIITAYGITDVIVTGAWKNWDWFDWIVNIGLVFLGFSPLLTAAFKALQALLVGGAFTAGKLATMGGVLGKIGTWIWAGYTSIKTIWQAMKITLFAKGSFLYNVAWYMGKIIKYLRKPYVIFGVLFASTLADGIGQRIYQIWGDLSLKAVDVAMSTFERFADEQGLHPIEESIAIIRGAKSSLPECFSAIWGAVGADVCIGLIISTFQYIMLYRAIREGYRLYGKFGDAR